MKKTLLLGLMWLGFVACRPSYHLTNRTASKTTIDSATARADSSVARFLAPYRKGVEQNMNEVLTYSAGNIDKGQPDGPLNDLLTDALLQQAKLKYGKPIDASHLNYGGIRNNLPKGPITIGSVFEVMPFDNQLVILTMKGELLQQLLDHFAKTDKLVVGGMRAVIRDGRATDVQFANGRTLHPDQTYVVALSDYIADGGDNASFLKNATQRETPNYLIRDALIDYFRQQGKSGQPLTPVSDGRITKQ